MKQVIALVLCLILCVCCAETTEQEENSFGDFTITLCDGSEFALSEALAEYDVLIINIWGSWCPWCVMEFPYMQEVWPQYSDRIGLVCLSNSDSNEDIAAFMRENNLTTLPMGYDAVNLTDWIVTQGFPTTAAFDSEGNCIYYECGAITSTEGFIELFEALLADIVSEYTIRVSDDSGVPVNGAMLSVCGEESCEVYTTDDSGTVVFEGQSYPYTVHMLNVPDGYSFDTAQELTFDGTELKIVFYSAAD